ncbi:MAG: thiol:disulfide interchange protein DsbA/DsbL [Xanthomonadales bacterium]|uniref:thiol:disulfide interchange protein DsbA/DsbL n=1 Tax=Dokdonella sp. TaxID=2291710 RepID=UPI002BB32E9A|nr:thiol:disulfide interchange protein DsbA/DsbL [Xanthomonadales bacterium]HQV72875.1 thiol:disulfide interchange protein DsbA/DsbL [Dokdonella sp.]MBK7012551.1 thiol:disulfide interchange protein DsbA/DsbL [Xanthomonadales bacterium]MBK7210644.1 thiol:disulfide interchange protein DsbA/DsbL [Xanthomonadales bacterium]MBL0223147.1 thiol:disulfide interchange protein DsbA/DsbL [Xanthomonadales bacterium]
MLKALLVLTAGLGLAIGSHARAQDNWVAGKNYFLIEPPQATTTGDKVEVVEVFSYACPHCNEVAPMVADLKKRLPANAELVLLPAQFGFEAWKVFARGFYTAQALGLVEKTHADLFRTIYVDRKIDIRSPTFASLAEFYSKYGVSAADFTATSESFAIKAKLKRNEELIKAYGADGTPTFIVNGKYRFSGQSAGGYEKIEPLVHYLIDKEAKGG